MIREKRRFTIGGDPGNFGSLARAGLNLQTPHLIRGLEIRGRHQKTGLDHLFCASGSVFELMKLGIKKSGPTPNRPRLN